MCTSDTNIKYKSAIKSGFIYLGLSIFCALFGAVYELFSYDVYSYFMIYAFAFPLIGGVCVYFSIPLVHLKMPSRTSMRLYNSGIASFTAGSIIKGVLDIYGTSNSLIIVYWIAGGLLTVLGIAVYLIQLKKQSPGQHRLN